jgi:hypothetical protein
MRLRTLSSFLTIAVLAMPALAATEVPVGQVQGVVYERTGEPLAGATIAVVGAQASAVSDARGRFRIEGVPAGAQVLKIHWSPEIPDAFEAVQVEAGKTRKMTINLHRGEWLKTVPWGQRFVLRLERDCPDASYLARDGALADTRQEATSNPTGEFGQQIDSARPWKVQAHYALRAEGVPLAIDVLDSAGVVVRHLRSGPTGPTGQVEWRGESDGAQECGPGNYTVRFAAPADTVELRLCLRLIPDEVRLNDRAGATLQR